MSTEETVVPILPKKTKGQIFKEKHGYSLTMKRNMKKYGVTTVEEYRVIRKENKKKRKKAKAVPVKEKQSSSPKKK